MASSIVDRPVVARSGEKELTGILKIREYDQNERIKRAVVTGVAWIFGTALCVAIPIAHFFLVPLGAIATPFVILFVARHKGSIVGADLACPSCGQPIRLLSFREKYPIFENCPHCRREVSIRPA
jgi:hypothetical protein